MKTPAPFYWSVLAALCLGLAGTVSAADPERNAEPKRPEPPTAPRAEAERSLDRLRAQLGELMTAGKLDEAEQVKKKIGELERETRPAPPPRRELADMEERARMMDEKIKDLRAAGDTAAAERVERERNAVRERIQAAREQGDFRGPGPMMREGGRMDMPVEPEQRMQHLRVAIEHLRAAGMPDEAMRLERITRQMQMGPPDGFPGQPGQPGDGRGRLQAPPNQERMDRMEAELRDLRQTVRELQRQLR
jgi:hypothetical protein